MKLLYEKNIYGEKPSENIKKKLDMYGDHVPLVLTLNQTTQHIGRQFIQCSILLKNYDVCHLMFTSIHPIGSRKLSAIHI